MWQEILKNLFVLGIPAIIKAVAEARREKRAAKARLKAAHKARLKAEKNRHKDEIRAACALLALEQRGRIQRLRDKRKNK